MRTSTELRTKELTQLEGVIRRGKKAFLEVGNALRTIRDKRLYKSTHNSFASYVEERFEFKRAYAYQLITTAESAESTEDGSEVSTIVDTIGSQGRAREVTKAPPEKRQAVVDRAEEIANERGSEPTAKVIAEARREVLGEVVEDSPEDEYEDVPDDDSEFLISFKDCVDDFRQATNRMSFVREMLNELEPHEVMILKEWLA